LIGPAGYSRGLPRLPPPCFSSFALFLRASSPVAETLCSREGSDTPRAPPQDVESTSPHHHPSCFWSEHHHLSRKSSSKPFEIPVRAIDRARQGFIGKTAILLNRSERFLRGIRIARKLMGVKNSARGLRTGWWDLVKITEHRSSRDPMLRYPKRQWISVSSATPHTTVTAAAAHMRRGPGHPARETGRRVV
jgi:hypothetical protein